MLVRTLPLVVLALLGVSHGADLKSPRNEHEAQSWLDEFNSRYQYILSSLIKTAWTHTEDEWPRHASTMLNAVMMKNMFEEVAMKNVTQLFDLDAMRNPLLVRQLRFIVEKGKHAAADVHGSNQTAMILQYMSVVLERQRFELDSGEVLTISTGLLNKIRPPTDVNIRMQVWLRWQAVVGAKIKPLFMYFVNRSNTVSMKAGYTDAFRALLAKARSSKNAIVQVHHNAQSMGSMYSELHLYARERLIDLYNSSFPFSDTGHIPAHLLGNLYMSGWEHVYSDLKPFPNRSTFEDVTETLKQQGYDVQKMLRKAEEFLVSLGMEKMPATFWMKSYLRTTTSGSASSTEDVVKCRKTLWDFYDQKDYRIRLCAPTSLVSLAKAHGYMAGLAYMMQYKHQPLIFRQPPNQAILDAVMELISLSVRSPKHLQALGLLNASDYSPEDDINFLMQIALEQVPVILSVALVDTYRGEIFDKLLKPDDYQKRWLDLVCRNLGISDPEGRGSRREFDAGGDPHIVYHSDVSRLSMSAAHQFQLLKALCVLAKHEGPLHECDIYNSREAGEALRGMMSLGANVSAERALASLTGSMEIDWGPFKEYFRPLTQFLAKENAGLSPGWSAECPIEEEAINNCPPGPHATATAMVLTFLFAAALLIEL